MIPTTVVLMGFLGLGLGVGGERIGGISDFFSSDGPRQQGKPQLIKVSDPFNVSIKTQFYDEKGILTGNIPGVNSAGSVYVRGRREASFESDERIHATVPELIEMGGPFQAVNYTVTTEDGYILTLFRIRSTQCTVNPDVYPVLFQHGGGLAFAGPGVRHTLSTRSKWIRRFSGQLEGNEYSNKHEYLSTKSTKYWDFSFHEMGLKDLPAVFNKILTVTGQPRVNYVGHGLGTTMLYVLLSKEPKMYKDKVFTMIGMAPTAYLARTTSPVKYLTPYTKLYKTFQTNGPLTPQKIVSFLHYAKPELCQLRKYGRSLCDAAIFFLMGENTELTLKNQTVSRIFGHLPSTTSIKTFVHYLQQFDFPSFREFDYGLPLNYLMYSQTVPPKYNLFAVRVKLLNYYGEKDILIDYKDVEQTMDALGSDVTKINVLIFNMTHLDFIYNDKFSLVFYPYINTYLGCTVASGACEKRSELSAPPEQECPPDVQPPMGMGGQPAYKTTPSPSGQQPPSPGAIRPTVDGPVYQTYRPGQRPTTKSPPSPSPSPVPSGQQQLSPPGTIRPTVDGPVYQTYRPGQRPTTKSPPRHQIKFLPSKTGEPFYGIGDQFYKKDSSCNCSGICLKDDSYKTRNSISEKYVTTPRFDDYDEL